MHRCVVRLRFQIQLRQLTAEGSLSSTMEAPDDEAVASGQEKLDNAVSIALHDEPLSCLALVADSLIAGACFAC